VTLISEISDVIRQKDVEIYILEYSLIDITFSLSIHRYFYPQPHNEFKCTVLSTRNESNMDVDEVEVLILTKSLEPNRKSVPKLAFRSIRR
jgi:hypothetical protein